VLVKRDIEQAAPADAGTFRSVLSRYCSGITVVATLDGARPVGFTCQSFFSVSLEPPLVAFAVSHSSTSYPRIRQAGAYCISVLNADHAGHSRTLSCKDPDKWALVEWTSGPLDTVRMAGSLAWIDCRLWSEHQCGDHTIVVGEVLDLGCTPAAGEPLLFFDRQYRRLHPEEVLP
jgi:3-hydroxy-9,10-secoandrosta-1,3,5(10)-triene-9,17-dione monooxygenase reductase component